MARRTRRRAVKDILVEEVIPNKGVQLDPIEYALLIILIPWLVITFLLGVVVIVCSGVIRMCRKLVGRDG
jgi:hypothetical protein